ncbi:hypothetical protein B0T16DRAFT_454835 [Cercophora newfieldiana]|uniref:Uncharacterized protein n=1 Tax=Cercophora newfieldiana TaxID=92897 RepID=A0AA39YH15_9PEZI|nr:hypothetical protein B0T16DRAFT_454835 [Cercophora newfieldiana]
MSTDLVSWIRGDKMKPNKKIMSTAVTVASKQAAPVMKTVQAFSGVSGIFKIGDTIKSVNEVSQNVNAFLPKVTQLVDSANQFIPTMQIMAHSVCDSVRIATRFQSVASTVGIGANLVLTYQGVKALHLIAAKLEDISVALAAQTALTAQRDFPEYVHDMIRERLGQTAGDPTTDHWFFLYHPDDDWYPKFYHLLEKKPVGPAFCGYTNQIDTIFVFMLAARRHIESKMRESGGKGGVRPVRFHLIIPAYQPILIAEALRVPEEIGDFVIEARTNSNKPFVWLNLPEDQRHYVSGIGQWDPTPLSWWDGVLSRVGLARRPPMLSSPRTLGTRQESTEDEDALAMIDDGRGEKGGELVKREVVEVGGSAEEGSKRHSTPLHHRQRRGERRGSRRSIEGERGEKGVVSRRESRSEGKRERSSSVS